MGHVTYISLVRRPLLSAFAAVYKFQRAHYHEPTFLWTRCRSELKTCWVPCRYWKVTGPSRGRELSWPLTRARAGTGSQHAVIDLDHFSAVETVVDLSGKCEGRHVADGSFEEVRAMCLFLHQEAIHLLEARAQIRGAIRCEKWYRMRCVTLLDSMAFTLALGRARARSFRLLLLFQRACAIGLAVRCRQYFRWIPSEGCLFPYQNFTVAPSCSRPVPTEASSVRRHEEAAGGRLNTTENAVPLIECT